MQASIVLQVLVLLALAVMVVWSSFPTVNEGPSELGDEVDGAFHVVHTTSIRGENRMTVEQVIANKGWSPLR